MLSVIIIGAGPGLAQNLPANPGPLPPPPTKAAPVVAIVTPGNGTMFLAPVDIPICAVTDYFTDTVASVEFFAGTNSLGVVTNSFLGLGETERCGQPGEYFCLTWTNVPPGAYALTARAKDLAGNTATSAASSQPPAAPWACAFGAANGTRSNAPAPSNDALAAAANRRASTMSLASFDRDETILTRRAEINAAKDTSRVATCP